MENSYGKPYIKMDEEHFKALSAAKTANYDLIYKNEAVDTFVEVINAKYLEKVGHNPEIYVVDIGDGAGKLN